MTNPTNKPSGDDDTPKRPRLQLRNGSRSTLDFEQAKIKAQLEILQSFRRNDFKLDSVYDAAVIKRIQELNQKLEQTPTLSRLEIIDETGRAYARGTIYGESVSLYMNYQDDGRTLKIFVGK